MFVSLLCKFVIIRWYFCHFVMCLYSYMMQVCHYTIVFYHFPDLLGRELQLPLDNLVRSQTISQINLTLHFDFDFFHQFLLTRIQLTGS